MKISALIGIVLIGMIAAARAQAPSLSDRYQHWLDEEVGYIITDAERREFAALRNDQAREWFIREFWEKRNPQPGKVENPFKEEHYRRLAYANEHFATIGPGWNTDRGKAYIQIGPPHSVESQVVDGIREEIWSYVTPAIKGKAASLIFVDHCSCGDYKFEGWRR